MARTASKIAPTPKTEVTMVTRLVCLKCGNKEARMYKSVNPKYAHFEQLPFCKDCLVAQYNSFLMDLKNTKLALVELCRWVDIPFSTKWYEAALKAQEERGTEIVQGYLKNINSFGQRRGSEVGKCFDDSADIYEVEQEMRETLEKQMETLPEDVVLEWGKGFEFDDYEFLERELAEYKKSYKCETRAEERLLREVCVITLQVREARRKGEDTEKLLKQMQDLMKTCAIDPAKATMAQAGKTNDTFGMWIKDIENTTPAEWFKEQDKFKDMDGLDDYLLKYVTRPIKNFTTGSRDFDMDRELIADFGEGDN